MAASAATDLQGTAKRCRSSTSAGADPQTANQPSRAEPAEGRPWIGARSRRRPGRPSLRPSRPADSTSAPRVRPPSVGGVTRRGRPGARVARAGRDPRALRSNLVIDEANRQASTARSRRRGLGIEMTAEEARGRRVSAGRTLVDRGGQLSADQSSPRRVRTGRSASAGGRPKATPEPCRTDAMYQRPAEWSAVITAFFAFGCRRSRRGCDHGKNPLRTYRRVFDGPGSLALRG